jgi:arsenate reductase
MSEIGIDISAGFPKKADRFVNQAFDYVITVCDSADRSCPDFFGTVGKRVHIGFPDPAQAAGSNEEKLAVFRAVRDEVRKRFREYYESEIRKGL